MFFKITKKKKKKNEKLRIINFYLHSLVEQLVSFPMNFFNRSETLLSANMTGFWFVKAPKQLKFPAF